MKPPGVYMEYKVKEMIIFLSDDCVSLRYSDGQCAGYGLDGEMQTFLGKDVGVFPRKIILHDQRYQQLILKKAYDKS